MATKDEMKQVESILRDLKTNCPLDADDATRGRFSALALNRIARHGITLGDEQVLARVSAEFSRDVGDMAEDIAARAIRMASVHAVTAAVIAKAKR